ncbi:ATP-dependent RNA helicase suv3, mitochondrial [Ceratocystis fimbriata CBS 114723]|uniref:RNA helicase n=1 Tax=Ceratocystis fimbriata CBS 114723 TaxID=1035309 RepID=A0A2C5WY18_9PEZI|nr:ATP-dependent RNA helicase suv3, mitochondrial [Ceratocystis fimbriata CBS 114723]
MQKFKLHGTYKVPEEEVQFAIENGEVPAIRPKPKSKHQLFHDVVLVTFARLAPGNESLEVVRSKYESFGIKTLAQYINERGLFRKAIDQSLSSSASGYRSKGENPLYFSLRQKFIKEGYKGLQVALSYAFQMFLSRHHFSESVTAHQSKLADLRFPWEWFPATRAMQRTVHLHVGPTNSGKTYHALKALENAKSGIYCGPLRLLAHEIFSRLEAKGKPCALMTGEEQRIPENVDDYYISCTVEMAPLGKPVDVAVIDEIQMISDTDRGSGWTTAFMGLQAKELHLCGEERTVDIIKSLCESIGDKCVVHRYNRLTPLKAASMPLDKQNNFSDLQKGDCIVAFSRMDLHNLKNTIEEATGKRCAIIYGNLPPEVRAQQAAQFNDPDNDYDFLVASDAIGMGLNLEIKRVIFHTTTKHDGYSWRQLTVSELRQIGGRAGRFKTARQGMINDDSAENKVGIVTALEEDDLKVVQANLWKDAPPIKEVSVFPPVSVIEQFSQYFPVNTPLDFVLLRLNELASLSSRFRIYIKDELFKVASIIQPFPMSIHDRCVLLTAPAYLRDPQMHKVLRGVARCISEMKNGHLLQMPEILISTLDINPDEVPESSQADYLRALESLHGSVVLYLWVSYRFPSVFTSQKLAFELRRRVQARINKALEIMKPKDQEFLERRRMNQRTLARIREQETSSLVDKVELEEVESVAA